MVVIFRSMLILNISSADTRLQDALENASNIGKSTHEIDGTEFLDFDIDSPEFRYLATIAVNNGKVFALFVRSPAKNFKASETQLRHIVDTFRLL